MVIFIVDCAFDEPFATRKSCNRSYQIAWSSFGQVHQDGVRFQTWRHINVFKDERFGKERGSDNGDGEIVRGEDPPSGFVFFVMVNLNSIFNLKGKSRSFLDP